jgi:Na+/H+ antiporter NhaC
VSRDKKSQGAGRASAEKKFAGKPAPTTTAGYDAGTPLTHCGTPMPATAPDIFSLVPVLLALVISISLRNVIVGLFTGLFAGVLMIEGPALLGGVSLMVRDYLVPQVTDSYNAGVLVLLSFIGGFVALMERSGGGTAFAAKVARFITTKARLQISAWIGGIVIFFSDLGTPLIVGPTFRPMADHLRVSRAKLAYIIDSTASPVAILVPFIGWGVYIMSLLEQQFTTLGIEQSDFQALVSALPFQFYAWLAVFAVPLLALTGVEFGPMARVERRAALEGLTPEEAASVALNAPPQGAGSNARASFIWLPLLVLFIVLLWTLVPLGFPFGRVSGADFRAGLSTAYLSAAVALILLMAFAGAQRVMASVQVYLEGMSRMMLVAVMLLLAWAMGDMTTALGGDVYVATLAAENAAPWALPVMIFLVSCSISFATGSSWGTFAIMLPLALPATVAIDAPLYVCIGAVLSGGLFGDHCSPISETTILSSTGAGCDAFEHFQTQLPYALANGVLCIGGYVLAGFTASVWTLALLIPLQVGGLVLYGKWRRRA